jgi:hypothetical protein
MTRDMPVKYGFSGIQLGIRICAPEAKCPNNSLYIVADKCKYIDQQTLKLQEAPEAVPTGEMPRHILLTVDRALVGVAVPGMLQFLLSLARIINSYYLISLLGVTIMIRYGYLPQITCAINISIALYCYCYCYRCGFVVFVAYVWVRTRVWCGGCTRACGMV